MIEYSNSKLNVYEECPFKYKLIYIDKIRRPEIESIESFLGDKVHKSLKKCYDNVRNSKIISLEELLKYYENLWDRDWHESIYIVREEYTPEHYYNKGKKMITSYYNRFAPFDADLTICTEKFLRFPLDKDNRYIMRCFVDRISKAVDGAIQIHDYKTSQYLPSQHEVENDRQLGLYQIGVRNRWPSVGNIRLVHHYLAHDTDFVISRTEDSITKLIESTIKLIDEIESASDFPVKRSELCEWCEYHEYCPEKKHMFKVAELPPDEYLKEDGVQLVNRYFELREQQKKIEEEMKRVKDGIIKYAEEEGVNVIVGSDCYARITMDERIKIPEKADVRREELKEIIVESGKWAEVSELDRYALKNVVKNQLWDEDLLSQINNYISIETSPTVRVYKSKVYQEEEEE